MDILPYIIVVYLAFLLFIHPPKAVVIASLLGGLAMGVINALADLLAYYAHWWHYTFKGLVLHLPLPFYATPILVYGGIVFLLIWRFWSGRGRWFALLLLFGTPLFGFLRDLGLALAQTGYLTWDSWLAGVFDAMLWLVMFYAGYAIFKRLSHGYEAQRAVSAVPRPGVSPDNRF
jgi:hypothetical protein